MDIPGEGEGGKSRVCMPKSGSERGLHLDLGYTFFFNSFPSGLPSTHRLLICSILPSTQSCYSARLNWDRPRSPRPRLPKYLFVFRVGLFFFFCSHEISSRFSVWHFCEQPSFVAFRSRTFNRKQSYCVFINFNVLLFLFPPMLRTASKLYHRVPCIYHVQDSSFLFECSHSSTRYTVPVVVVANDELLDTTQASSSATR